MSFYSSSLCFEIAMLSRSVPSDLIEAYPQLGDLVRECMNQNPYERPDFQQIVGRLADVQSTEGSRAKREDVRPPESLGTLHVPSMRSNFDALMTEAVATGRQTLFDKAHAVAETAASVRDASIVEKKREIRAKIDQHKKRRLHKKKNSANALEEKN